MFMSTVTNANLNPLSNTPQSFHILPLPDCIVSVAMGHFGNARGCWPEVCMRWVAEIEDLWSHSADLIEWILKTIRKSTGQESKWGQNIVS